MIIVIVVVSVGLVDVEEIVVVGVGVGFIEVVEIVVVLFFEVEEIFFVDMGVGVGFVEAVEKVVEVVEAVVDMLVFEVEDNFVDFIGSGAPCTLVKITF